MIQYLSCIVAVILGFAAFYGIKSLFDIEQKINEFAKDEVSRSVKKQISQRVKPEAEEKLRETLQGDYVNALKEEMLREVLSKWGNNIEDRIGELESHASSEDKDVLQFDNLNDMVSTDNSDSDFDNQTNNPKV